LCNECGDISSLPAINNDAADDQQSRGKVNPRVDIWSSAGSTRHCIYRLGVDSCGIASHELLRDASYNVRHQEAVKRIGNDRLRQVCVMAVHFGSHSKMRTFLLSPQSHKIPVDHKSKGSLLNVLMGVAFQFRIGEAFHSRMK
jgi:hypothetical protein